MKTDRYIFGNINDNDIADVAETQKLAEYRKEFEAGIGEYVCNPDVCDLNKYDLCRGGCATHSAYSRVDYETGLIVANENRHRYSEFREDPLCAAWTVLAEQQGISREGLLDDIHRRLVETSTRLDKAKYAERKSFI